MMEAEALDFEPRNDDVMAEDGVIDADTPQSQQPKFKLAITGMSGCSCHDNSIDLQQPPRRLLLRS